MLALTVFGAIPALLIPEAGRMHAQEAPAVGVSMLSFPIVLWLTCAVAGGAAVAVVEIGAVGLAVRFGYEPALAILFTVPLCVASVTGGIWVNVRNRMASRMIVVAQLSVMTVGSFLAAWGPSLPVTAGGAVLIGLMLAPLGTYYALAVDRLAPPEKRPEVFALLRTATTVGIIFASALVTVVSLSSALIVVAATMLAVTLTVALSPRVP